MTLFGNLYLAAVMVLAAAGAIWLVPRTRCPYDNADAEQRSDADRRLK